MSGKGSKRDIPCAFLQQHMPGAASNRNAARHIMADGNAGCGLRADQMLLELRIPQSQKGYGKSQVQDVLEKRFLGSHGCSTLDRSGIDQPFILPC